MDIQKLTIKKCFPNLPDTDESLLENTQSALQSNKNI